MELRDRDKTSKRCNGCGIERPVSEFYWQARKWSHLCRDCKNENARNKAAQERATRPPKPPKEPKPVRVRVSWADRFWSKADVRSDSECWEWLGPKTEGGYGTAYAGNYQRTTAHRVAYTLTHGPIPDGLTIDHLCHNRSCVNPAHLEAVTQSVNNLRKLPSDKPRRRKTHCKHGHEFTPENTRIATDGAQRCRECARLQQSGFPTRQRRYGPKKRHHDSAITN